MSLETEFYKGQKGKPMAVFIHGMGMNTKVWSSPSEARVLGGRYTTHAEILFDREVRKCVVNAVR